MSYVIRKTPAKYSTRRMMWLFDRRDALIAELMEIDAEVFPENTRLINLRYSLNLSEGEAAELLQVSVTTIRRWEKGTLAVADDVYARLTDAAALRAKKMESYRKYLATKQLNADIKDLV